MEVPEMPGLAGVLFGELVSRWDNSSVWPKQGIGPWKLSRAILKERQSWPEMSFCHAECDLTRAHLVIDCYQTGDKMSRRGLKVGLLKKLATVCLETCKHWKPTQAPIMMRSVVSIALVVSATFVDTLISCYRIFCACRSMVSWRKVAGLHFS